MVLASFMSGEGWCTEREREREREMGDRQTDRERERKKDRETMRYWCQDETSEQHPNFKTVKEMFPKTQPTISTFCSNHRNFDIDS